MKKIFFPNFFYPIQFNMTNNEILEGFKIIGIDFTKLWAFSPIPSPESFRFEKTPKDISGLDKAFHLKVGMEVVILSNKQNIKKKSKIALKFADFSKNVLNFHRSGVLSLIGQNR